MGVRATRKHYECLIRKNGKSAVFFIKEILPAMRWVNAKGIYKYSIRSGNDKYINMEISGTAWKTTLTLFQFHTERND